MKGRSASVVTVRGYLIIMKTFRVDSRLMIEIVWFSMCSKTQYKLFDVTDDWYLYVWGNFKEGSIPACLVGTSAVFQILRTKFHYEGENVKP